MTAKFKLRPDREIEVEIAGDVDFEFDGATLRIKAAGVYPRPLPFYTAPESPLWPPPFVLPSAPRPPSPIVWMDPILPPQAT